MSKKVKYNNELPIFYIIISIVVIILLFINLAFINKFLTEEPVETETIYFTKVEGEYDKTKQYYASINYKSFKKIYKGSEISTIAVIDNSSKTSKKFKELINKTAFYKNTKIYLLEISKLSRKNEIAFYNIDERLSKLNANYIITVSNNKIIAVTTFEEEYINEIIEGLGE